MRMPLFIARQARRPSGLLGHIVARVMAVETARENVFALELLELATGERVLEVGCGHGATLKAAAARASGLELTGVDHSEVMLRVARHRNRHLVAEGRLRLDQGDSAHLRYPDESFEKIWSVHTIYFWSEPQRHLSEIHRVLAPGGRFVLGFHPGDDPAFVAAFPAPVYHIRRLAEVEALIKASGFGEVRTLERRIGAQPMNWAVARKS